MPRVIDPQDLRQIPLFQLLDDNELAALTDQLEVRKYWKGQMVFWQGSPGDTMFLVHSGRVELYIKDKRTLYQGQKRRCRQSELCRTGRYVW